MSSGRIPNQTGEENESGNGGATKRNQLTSGGNSCTIGGTGAMGAITSGGVGGNGTGLSGGVGGVPVTGGTGMAGGVSMAPGSGLMVVSAGGVIDDPMAATGTNSSRPYDTPERRSSIRLRGQSVVNDGRNVK